MRSRQQRHLYKIEAGHAKRVVPTIDMPEGPECCLLAQKLHKWVSDRRITMVTIIEGRYHQHGPPVGFERLKHATVQAVGAKGKLIYWILDNDTAILNTLGLSGTWHKSKSKHCGVRFDFEKSTDPLNYPTHIWFKDQLHYGTLKVVTHADLQKKIRSLGWDCLKNPTDAEHGLTLERWKTVCGKHPSWTMPKLLMTQTCVSGVGNYLKSEILYDAQVSPHTKVNECTDEEIERIWSAVTRLPRHALDTKQGRGLVIRGRFRMKVYRKKTDPEGNVVKREKTTDNRMTHWVPALTERS